MSFFNELKRRNVFRIAGISAVVGWILMQVAGTLEASLNLAEWFDSVITAGLLIGFPIALLFAWAFEMTPEGVKPTDALEGDANTTSSSKKMDSVIIVGIVLVLALGLWQQMTKPIATQIKVTETKTTETKAALSFEKKAPIKITKEIEILDASIAVLAFSDLSQAGDQGYFSDGIAEEILNVLVRVDSLKVASRTSAFGFKGQEALGIPLIAKKLKVRHILEGSVRKSGNMIRITAQLIDAQTDQHLWSQTYDRTLSAENIFIIQDEISSEIVKALRSKLKVKIGDVQGLKIDTKNLDAYELYLKARQKFFVRNTENNPEIIELAKQATDLDPNFAEAWAGLAAAYSVATSWGVAGDGHIKNSISAAEKAIALDPSLALPYAVLQNNLTKFIPVNFEKAFEYSNKALSLDPKNTTVLLWRGINELASVILIKPMLDLKNVLRLIPLIRIVSDIWHSQKYMPVKRKKHLFCMMK
jgi:TolB-like protein